MGRIVAPRPYRGAGRRRALPVDHPPAELERGLEVQVEPGPLRTQIEVADLLLIIAPAGGERHSPLGQSEHLVTAVRSTERPVPPRPPEGSAGRGCRAIVRMQERALERLALGIEDPAG